MKKIRSNIYIKIGLLLIGLMIPLLIEKIIYPLDPFDMERFRFFFLSIEFLVINIAFDLSKIYKFLLSIIKKIYNKINEYWTKFIELKYVKFIFKFLPHNILIFIVFIAAIFELFNFNIDYKKRIIYSQPKFNKVLKPIYKNEVEITFNRKYKRLAKPNNICFMFSTLKRENTADYKIEIYYKDELIGSQKFNSKNIKNNSYNCFDIDTMEDLDNLSNYKVKLIPINATKKNSISIFTDAKKYGPVVSLYEVNNNPFSTGKCIIFSVFLLLFFTLNYFINKKDIKLEKMWLILAFVYFIPALFIIPPYQAPDEFYHYYNSYNMSQYNFKKSIYSNFDKDYFIAPKNFKCVDYSRAAFYDKVYDFSKISKCLNSTENTKINYSGYKNHNSKLGYLITAPTIKIVDTFTNSPLIIFYAGRLANLIFSIIVVYFCIKKVPKYKDIIFGICTIPMLIFQFSSYSYDVLLNLACIVSICTILKLIYDTKSKWKLSTIILIACSLFISEIKYVYLPIFLLALLIPDEKFKNKWYKYLYTFSIILGPYIAYYIIHRLVYMSSIDTHIVQSTLQVRSGTNLNPINLIRLYINTLNVHAQHYVYQLFGRFGWLKFELRDWIVNSYVVFMGYLVITNSRIESKKRYKCLAWLGVIAMFVGILYSMYIWTLDMNFKVSYIEGAQGRYFLPFLPMILLLALPKKKLLDSDNKLIYYFVNLACLYYLIMLIAYYY